MLHELLITHCTNTSVTKSETTSEMLPAIPSASKMTFPGDHIPIRKVLLLDAKILADMQEQFNSLINGSEDIMF